MSHARMTTLLFSIFLIISPDPLFIVHAAFGKPGFRGISRFLFELKLQKNIKQMSIIGIGRLEYWGGQGLEYWGGQGGPDSQ